MKLTTIIAIPALFILFSCSKPSNPTPTVNTGTTSGSNNNTGITVVKTQSINNTYTLGTSSSSYATYTATLGGEEKTTYNGSNIYTLLIEDGSGNALEFWFTQKPGAGTYQVTNAANSPIPSGGVSVITTVNGGYLSIGTGSVIVGVNGDGSYTVTATSITLQNTTATAVLLLNASVNIP